MRNRTQKWARREKETDFKDEGISHFIPRIRYERPTANGGTPYTRYTYVCKLDPK